MALPRLNTPTYELELPSTGEKIKYRPFLIKEQKLLLIAQESGEDSQLMDAMIELVLSCTFGKIDANKYPIFDVEYLFLQIRARSVGETVDLNLICPDETQVPVTINLQELSVAVKEEHSNIAKLNDKISIHFRYPILSDMKGLQGQASEMETMFHVINNCVNEIHDGDEIYRRIDMSESEINEFIDSLSAKQFEKITEFFQTTPKLRHVIKVTNPKTKVKGEVVLEGLTDFLG
jgi:hypothetical protein